MSTHSHGRVLDAVIPPPPATGDTFPILDTLRAVGAVCVLTTHTSFWAGTYTQHGTWGTLLARLDVGVAIFFVLSGFLLARPWLVGAADQGARPPVARYLRKRALRILPLYLVTVALAMLLIHDNQDLGAGRWLRTLLMLDTVVSDSFPAGLTHMWSLAAEVSFYLILPLLMVAMLGRSGRLHPPRVLIGLLLLVALATYWHLDGAGRVGEQVAGAPLQWLPAFLTWFALGILLALVEVLHARGSWSRLTRPIVALGRQPGSCWVVAAGLMLLAATPLAGPTLLGSPTEAQSLTKSLLYAAVAILVVSTGVFVVPGSRYAEAFGHVAARRLGWISYGIFCLHLPVLHLVMWTTGWPLFQGHGLQLWTLTLAVSIVVAELSYRLVERPALRLKGPRRVPRSSQPSAATTPTRDTSAT